MFKIISWNVNGIRALINKGIFIEFLNKENPDLFCIQETKAQPGQLPSNIVNVAGYLSYWSFDNEKKGYSGTAIYSRVQPQGSIQFKSEILQKEGRIVGLEFENFYLFNVYFPNGKQSKERLEYKMRFYEEFLLETLELESRKAVIFCGDINTAHKEIDLARPKDNETVSGFLPIEREWIDRVVSAGYIDAFRKFNKEPGNYTWWDLKTRARERGIGWRIDYFFVSPKLEQYVANCYHLTDQMGSDHCPVVLELNLDYNRIHSNVNAGDDFYLI